MMKINSMTNKEVTRIQPLRGATASIFLSVLLLSGCAAGAAAQDTKSATTTPPPAASTPAPAANPAPTATDAPPPPIPQVLASVNATTYVIGADDQLQITVWREPTLSGVVPVRPDGNISIVLAGDIPAAGLTPIQLGADIANRLKKFIQDPSVSVVVTAVNSQRIFMIGEIGKVGPLMLSPGMTPLQAIASAGGLSTFANSKRIYILRGPQGKQIKIPFNYKQALKGDSKQLITLQPGDTIVVP
jgi:polysaccharide export outer membrane protein